MEKLEIFIETGKKKTFAGVIDWPGWIRWGKDEHSALASLMDYGVRYADVLNAAGIRFNPPGELSDFVVIERHSGNITTDFGAHDIVLDGDSRPVSQDEHALGVRILQASWVAFDQAVNKARGRELRKGPRGGGRDLDAIMRHVLEADWAYLRRLAWRVKKPGENEISDQIQDSRTMILEALDRAMKEGLPERGPRGGKIWPVRFFIRRVAWHVLDHAWEIEDRLI